MKNIIIFFFFVFLKFIKAIPPKISVNYPDKNQWKMSKHDYLNIKLEIEKEVKNMIFYIKTQLKAKIQQAQLEWNNRRKIEQATMLNVGYPPMMMTPNYYPPQAQIIPDVRERNPNYRFKQTENQEKEKLQKIEMEKLALKTIDEIQQLTKELEQLKSEDNLNNKKEENKKTSVETIMNKYRSKSIDQEMSIFNKMVRNLNQTTAKHVNIKEVNEKIKNSVENKNFLKRP